MDKQKNPAAKPPRVSVPVSAEVLAVFQRLAEATNVSTGRAIASWLQDTFEAAEYLASAVERARKAPQVVTRELHAYALGMADETQSLLRQVAELGEVEREAARKRVAARAAGEGEIQSPPSCNTGGKLPTTRGKKQKGAT